MNKRRQFKKSEQRVLEKSLEAKSLEAQVADLEKDLASARAGHMEAEFARTEGVEQSTTLAKSLHEKEVALQRAEQKVATVEAKFDEHKKATLGDRALFEEKIAKLTEQLDAESAARLFAEGALRSARQERSALRQEGHDGAAEPRSGRIEFCRLMLFADPLAQSLPCARTGAVRLTGFRINPLSWASPLRHPRFLRKNSFW